jgi:hypothetical protein
VQKANLRDQQHRGTVAPTAACPASPTGVERRRPGRLEYVSPELVALLRWRAEEQIVVERVHSGDPSEQDALRAAKGIAIALALSTLFWAAVAFGLLWLL